MNDLKRRSFLKRTAAAVGGVIVSSRALDAETAAGISSKAMTVTGEIPATSLGSMLPHEHVMSFFGAEITEKPVYDEPLLLESVGPYLKKLKGLGCDTLADCTTAYFGREPQLLQRISKKTGIQILTNTGYYAAADDRYVPKHAYSESADRLAKRWIDEWKNGIGETGIRPGFIKTGVDNGPLSEIDAKIVRATAITHLETGLVIAAHTGDNPESANAQVKILREEGVAPSAWIWVHANNVESSSHFLKLADQGAWIELDGINEESGEKHFSMVDEFKKRNLGNRLLLSHDGNSFRYGDRPPKAYHGLYSTFIPFMKKKGYSQQDIDQLTRKNPAAAFAVAVRAL